MATLKDISSRLGLSTATVSRALNGFDDVSPDTRKRIEEAARELGYVPNRAAKSLVSGRSNIICLIADLELVRKNKKLGAPDFLELISSLSSELAELGYDLMFSVKTPKQDVVLQYSEMIKRGVVDSFIVGAPAQDDSRIKFLEDAKFPFTVHGLAPKDSNAPYVSADNAQIIRDPLLALLDLGHQRVGIIHDHPGTTHGALRTETYLSTLKDAGQSPSEHLIFDHGADATALRSYLLGLFSERLGPKPTALMCGTVHVAAEAARILSDLGLGIPQDVSLVAHDDGGTWPAMPASVPELCRTYFDWTETCAPLARMAIATSQTKPPYDDPERQLIQCEMIFGRSIAKPKDHPATIT
ncbi:MAG: LacI family DNA-binding transcriptional regulator [Pseudomonadota bacterium]